MIRWISLLLVVIMLSGCRVGPVYEEPEMELPCAWQEEPVLDCPADSLPWWEALNDPLLNQMIATLAYENIDLQIAAIRVLKARGEANAKKSDLYPHIDGSLNYGHVYYSKDALVNGLLGTALPVNNKNVKRHVNFYEVGFDADWEIDLFGRTAHEIAALKAHEEAVQENLGSIWVTLSAELAKNYIELRGFQEREKITIELVDIHQQEVSLTQELVSRGLVEESEIEKIKSAELIAHADLSRLQTMVKKAAYRISILLGESPGYYWDVLECYQPLPVVPCHYDLGVPSDLLRRRPDIRRAERELASSTEKIGSSIAALFPRFSLRGFIGEISTHAGSLFSPASATWLAGPQILVPIFNSRLLLQEVSYSKLETQESLFTYQKTVIEALEETENAIASFKSDQARDQLFQKNNEMFKQRVVLNDELYKRGVKDNLALASSKKAYLSARETALQGQVDALISYIALYKALGGCW